MPTKVAKEVHEDADVEDEEARVERKRARKAAKKAAKLAEEQGSGGGEEEVDEEEAKAARKAAKKAAKRAAKEAERDAEEEDSEKKKKKDKKKRKAEEEEESEETTEKKVSKKSKEGKGGKEDKPKGPQSEEDKYREKLGINVSGGEGEIPACLRKLSDAPFDEAVIKAMASAGFSDPSAIQAQCWPVAVRGQDLVAVAKTGSGKTLGFLLPAFKMVAAKKAEGSAKGPLTLVMAPTRELACQIEVECQKFAKIQGITSCCIYGGAPPGPQKASLAKNPHVIIATPGRLVDMMGQGACSLGGCSYVVLDEADRMLDMGFEPQITQIFGKLPPVGGRQTLLFTATWPKAIWKLAGKFLKEDVIKIFAQGGEDAELAANRAVSQVFIEAQDDAKDAKLWKVLTEDLDVSKSRIVVFANTKRRVDYLCKALWDEGMSTCSIHGDKQQSERDKALKQFIDGERPLLFATDVAARGLDIKGVTHVINFDMARDVESYIHRIGRTGRAGELGAAITFWNPDYDKECTPALCRIARDAGQAVPDWLQKYEKNKVNKQWKVEDAVL